MSAPGARRVGQSRHAGTEQRARRGAAKGITEADNNAAYEFVSVALADTHDLLREHLWVAAAKSPD